MRRLGAAALAAGALGVTVPAGAQDAPPPVATVAGPQSTVVVDLPTAEHWFDIAHAADGTRQQVMQFLISSWWIIGEAAERGVSITDEAVRKEFEAQRRQSFPTTAQYERFLKEAHYVEADLLFRIKTQDLSNLMRERLTKPVAATVTDAKIEAYFRKNRARFRTPARRTVRIARATTPGGALRRWRRTGGNRRSMYRGEHDNAARLVFATPEGRRVGPVRAGKEWVVLRVTGKRPAHQERLAEARQSIRQLLVSQGKQAVLDAFVNDFQTRWRARTRCAEGTAFTAACKAAVKP